MGKYFKTAIEQSNCLCEPESVLYHSLCAKRLQFVLTACSTLVIFHITQQSIVSSVMDCSPESCNIRSKRLICDRSAVSCDGSRGAQPPPSTFGKPFFVFYADRRNVLITSGSRASGIGVDLDKIMRETSDFRYNPS